MLTSGRFQFKSDIEKGANMRLFAFCAFPFAHERAFCSPFFPAGVQRAVVTFFVHSRCHDCIMFLLSSHLAAVSLKPLSLSCYEGLEDDALHFICNVDEDKSSVSYSEGVRKSL